MVKPKILSDLPPVVSPRQKPPVPTGAPQSPPSNMESIRQTILKAMMEKNPDLMNKAEPGAMGAEGAAPMPPGMPPDQAPAAADEFLDPNAPGASGAAPLPPAGPSPMTDVARALPLPQGGSMGVETTLPEMSGAPPAAEARFQGGTAVMDRQIARNLANNRMLAKKAGVTPEQLLEAMPPAYSGQRPPPQPGSRQAMIDALLKGIGVQ